MNTKDIGNKGEAAVLHQLTKFDYSVYVQFGDNEPADYITLKNGKLTKIQVKTSNGNDETVCFDLTSNYKIKGKIKKHKYTLDEVDYFLCYDINSDKIFCIKNNGKMNAIMLRYNKPKNGQIKNINFAEELIFKNNMF